MPPRGKSKAWPWLVAIAEFLKNPLAGPASAPVALEQSFEQIDHDRDTQEIKADVAAILQQLQQASDADIAHQLDLVGLTDHLTPEQLRTIMRRRASRAGLINDDARLQAYRDYVARAYQYVDFVGVAQQARFVSLPLDDVFVPLSAVPEETLEASHQEERDRLRGLEQAGTGAARDEVEAELGRREGGRLLALERRSQPRPVADVLRTHRRVVFLGDPGSGKTTLLKWLARACARGAAALRDAIGCDDDLLPLLLPVADYGRALEDDPGLTLGAHLRQRLEQLREPEGAGFGDLAVEKLAQGSCLVLLDGLDEIPDPKFRLAAARGVSQLMVTYPGNRYLVTSRIYGYSLCRLSGEVAHYLLQGFTDDEMKQFAHSWWEAYERVQHPEAPNLAAAEQQAQDLITAISEAGHPQLVDFARNPLLLTILALIKQQRVKLPERRVELYEVALRTLTESWGRARGLGGPIRGVELDLNQSLRVWQRVAFWMHSNRPTGTVHRSELLPQLQTALTEELGLTVREAEHTAESYLQAALGRTGLLQARGENLFAFLHQTFQEYLAARHVARPPHTAFDRIASHLHDPRWREVILLTAGYLGAVLDQPEYAGQFVDSIRSAGSKYEHILHRDLLLAAACLSDRTPVDRGCEQETSGTLCCAAATERADGMIAALSSALACLDDIGPSPSYLHRLTRLASHSDARIRYAAVCALRGCGDDLACTAVESALSDSSSSVAGCAAAALLRRGRLDKLVLQVLAVGLACPSLPDPRGLSTTRDITAAIRDSRTETRLVHHVSTWLGGTHPVLRMLARDALHALAAADDYMLGLISTWLDHETKIDIEDKRNLELSVARLHLGQSAAQRERAVSALLAQLEDEDTWVRWDAVRLLASSGIREKRVVSALLMRLHDAKGVVRASAMGALVELGVGNEKLDRSLLLGLEDADALVRRQASLALGQAEEKESVVAALLARLADEDWLVRASAALALGALGSKGEPVVSALLSHLDDDSRIAAAHAAWALSELGVREQRVVSVLLERLLDNYCGTPVFTAKALREPAIKQQQVVPALLARLEAGVPGACHSAVEALGNIGAKGATVISALLRCLQNETEYVRISAATVLTDLAPLDDATVSSLTSLLSHSDPDVRYHAATVLVADEASRV